HRHAGEDALGASFPRRDARTVRIGEDDDVQARIERLGARKGGVHDFRRLDLSRLDQGCEAQGIIGGVFWKAHPGAPALCLRTYPRRREYVTACFAAAQHALASIAAAMGAP